MAHFSTWATSSGNQGRTSRLHTSWTDRPRHWVAALHTLPTTHLLRLPHMPNLVIPGPVAGTTQLQPRGRRVIAWYTVSLKTWQHTASTAAEPHQHCSSAVAQCFTLGPHCANMYAEALTSNASSYLCTQNCIALCTQLFNVQYIFYN